MHSDISSSEEAVHSASSSAAQTFFVFVQSLFCEHAGCAANIRVLGFQYPKGFDSNPQTVVTVVRGVCACGAVLLFFSLSSPLQS